MGERIAIVGTGIAGLTVAHLLARRHDLTIYEAEDWVGGHTHTIDLTEGGRRFGVDTGFIVHNRRTYPNFCRLMEELGVPTQPSDMSFSLRDDAGDLEYGAPEPHRLLAQPRNLVRPRFWRMLRQILRFYREAPRRLEGADIDPDLDLETWLRREGYDAVFIEDHLFPVASSIWSGSRRRLGEFPVRAFLRFFRNHGLLSLTGRPRWRTVVGGSARYVERLIVPFADSIRLSTPVVSVRRDADGVEIRTAAAPPERFDRVVLACHADQALALLADPTPLETEFLGAFPYAENVATLHTDPAPMPRRRAAWSSWNALKTADPDAPVVLSYYMTLLLRLDAGSDYLVTLNLDEAVDPSRVVGRYVYAHPQYDARAIALQSRHEELNGPNRTYYCGAYWGYGFHEDGVASGLRVANHFGETL